LSIINIIKTRTSYRGKYLDKPIPKEDLITIMEAGLAAPSGCNKQTTSLITINDPYILRQIHRLVQPPIGETAPAMICVLTQRIYAYRDKCFSTQDYSAAIQNMLLAIVDLGYQSCWIEGHITDSDQIGRKIADLLDVPETYELVCILPIGIASESVRKVTKKPIERRAWFNGFNRWIEK